MLIHFASDPRQRCDNCGTRGTLMHLVLAPSDGSLDLCRTCFGALVLALNGAARKLGMSGKTRDEVPLGVKEFGQSGKAMLKTEISG